ncbi:MAG: DUF1998 domain-containing protein [Ignavibacteriota bacterium]
MTGARYIKPQGELRQSQVVMTFGPGSMVDLPKHSVLIAGLDYWSGGGTEIFEARLAAKAAKLLDLPSVRLVTPPPSDDDPLGSNPHIEAFQFPEWFITQDNERDSSPMFGRTRLLVHRKGLSRGAYIDRNKKRRSVVPIRFVRACRSGHIGDIDWYAFVHQGKTECTQQQRQLFIDERGTSGDLTEIFIRCECGKAERSVAQAARFQDRALGNCDGSRPWLGPFTKESCGEPSRLLIRSASNAYFPQTMSVISLPDRDEAVRKAVEAAWDFLDIVETMEDLEREMRRPKVREALDGVSPEEAFAQIQRRHTATPTPDKSVKHAELETLAASKDEIGSDQAEGAFYARSLPKTIWDRPWMKPIERIVLVHRLREVGAQVGFTRFESAAPDIEGELDLGVKRAVLARETTWLPAYENKGEGIFLQFSSAYLNDWLQKPKVLKQGIRLKQGFDAWKAERQGSSRVFPGLPYVALHGFSHLLLTAVALECGYPASSIRERIYAIPSVGYGVLLYTGSSDAEGTLGGLIQVGRRIHNSVRSALELGLLCSNDPICAQHDPESRQEHRHLQGAACHGCVLTAETSCEQQNDFLDRALVVKTVEELGAELFSDAGW